MEEARLANLEFQRIFDLYPATEAALDGAVLRVRQLHAVAVTLEAAIHLRDQLGMLGGKASDDPPPNRGNLLRIVAHINAISKSQR